MRHAEEKPPFKAGSGINGLVDRNSPTVAVYLFFPSMFLLFATITITIPPISIPTTPIIGRAISKLSAEKRSSKKLVGLSGSGDDDKINVSSLSGKPLSFAVYPPSVFEKATDDFRAR